MTNLLERAINTADSNRAAKIIQNALGIESERCELLLPENVAEGS